MERLRIVLSRKLYYLILTDHSFTEDVHLSFDIVIEENRPLKGCGSKSHPSSLALIGGFIVPLSVACV